MRRLTPWMCDILRRWPPKSRTAQQSPVSRASLRGMRLRGLVESVRGDMDRWRLTDLGAMVAASLRIAYGHGVLHAQKLARRLAKARRADEQASEVAAAGGGITPVELRELNARVQAEEQACG